MVAIMAGENSEYLDDLLAIFQDTLRLAFLENSKRQYAVLSKNLLLTDRERTHVSFLSLILMVFQKNMLHTW